MHPSGGILPPGQACPMQQWMQNIGECRRTKSFRVMICYTLQNDKKLLHCWRYMMALALCCAEHRISANFLALSSVMQLLNTGNRVSNAERFRTTSVCSSFRRKDGDVQQLSNKSCIHLRRRQWLCKQAVQLSVVSASAETMHKTHPASSEQVLPNNLQKYVAHLALQSQDRLNQVYILGASHVSRQSCNHAAQLISHVKPDTVLLELCKDRVDLLIDPSLPAPQHWHSRIINFQSNFDQQSRSAASACKKLLSSLRCQPGKAFTAHDIEQDCIQLLSSGMFASVVPMTQPASASDAPMFIHSSNQVTGAPHQWPHTLLHAICHVNKVCHVNSS